MHTTASCTNHAPVAGKPLAQHKHALRHHGSVTVTHFMRSRHDHEQPASWDLLTGSSSLDETLQGTMSTAAQHARDSLGWLRHAFQDPDDFSASAIGRMVSKEYGRHERPHTERHMWAATSCRSPVSDKASQEATDASSAPQSPQQAVQEEVGGWMSGWGWGLSSSVSPQEEVYHSPPSGPGFLLQQQAQKRQE